MSRCTPNKMRCKPHLQECFVYGAGRRMAVNTLAPDIISPPDLQRASWCPRRPASALMASTARKNLPGRAAAGHRLTVDVEVLDDQTRVVALERGAVPLRTAATVRILAEGAFASRGLPDGSGSRWRAQGGKRAKSRDASRSRKAMARRVAELERMLVAPASASAPPAGVAEPGCADFAQDLLRPPNLPTSRHSLRALVLAWPRGGSWSLQEDGSNE